MSKSKFLGVALATFVAFAFTGCDEVKGLFSSIKEPLVNIELDNKLNPILVIQSQDNETIINAVKLNRGNCDIVLYETSKESLLAYARANRDRVFFKGIEGFDVLARITFVKNGEAIEFESMSDLWFSGGGLKFYNSSRTKLPLFGDTDGLALYNGLDEASKRAFVSVYPVKLPYGEKFNPRPNCAVNKIIEVELETNGGTFTYNFEKGGIQ